MIVIVPLVNLRNCAWRYVARLLGNRRGRLLMGLMVLSASAGVLAGARIAAAQASPLPCGARQFHVSLTTNTPTARVGQVVVMRATLENASTVTCTVTLGATTPTFTVYDRDGKAVWSYCDSLVRSETCPQYLRLVTLAPGHRVVTTASWATSNVAPVTPAGTYRLEWRFVGTPIAASIDVYLALSTSSLRIISEVDAGRVVTVNVGQKLELRLDSSTYIWSTPRLSNTSVITSVSSATASPLMFVATSPGRVVMITVGTPRCYPQCLIPSRLVRVVVRVLQPSPGAR